MTICGTDTANDTIVQLVGSGELSLARDWDTRSVQRGFVKKRTTVAPFSTQAVHFMDFMLFIPCW